MQEGAQGILNNQKSAGGAGCRERFLCGCQTQSPSASGTPTVPALDQLRLGHPLPHPPEIFAWWWHLNVSLLASDPHASCGRKQ